MAEGKKKVFKTAIYGGSFDPPHLGHIDIARNLESVFDRVIVVPSYVSPFKVGAADPKVRLKLCKTVFTSAKTEVNSREIKRHGTSYSVDTAAYFAKKYAGEKLFWVIGSEELLRLVEWHDIDRLKTLVEFFVVPRPGFAVSPALLKSLKARKIKIKFAKFRGLDISSTEIKIDMAFGKPNRFLPYAVYGYAQKHGLFDPYGRYVHKLYEYGVTDKRIAHTYGVAVRGAELAKLYGGNVNDAVIACILHDIAKSVDPSDYEGVVEMKGFPKPTLHSPIGAYIAKQEFDVSPEIEHAIYAHTTGDENMSLLDEIVYLADKTEAGRNYSEVYYFRYLCTVDRDLAMYAMLTAITEFRDTKPCAMTDRAIIYYEKRCKGKPMPEMPPRYMDFVPAVRPDNSVAQVPSGDIMPVENVEKGLRLVPEQAKDLRPVFPPVVPEKPHMTKNNASVAEIAETIARELDLHKAHDIDIIDLDGKTIVADYFVIASAGSSTAVKALYGYVEDRLTKDFGIDPRRRDIDREWVALDYGSIIIHIFTDKMREFYNIERLWSDGTNVKRYGE